MIKTIVNDFAENTYIINEKRAAYIIDPGSNFSEIAEYLNKKDFIVLGILLTHCHFDHLLSVNKIMKEYKTKVFIHEKEKACLFDPHLNLSGFATKKIIIEDSAAVTSFNEKTKFIIGDESIKVIETPGHSSGSVCFKYKNSLFSGDTLFKGTIGRTDLPTSNTLDIQKSILKIINFCNDKTTVYPGHGSATTIKTEKATNPFVKG